MISFLFLVNVLGGEITSLIEQTGMVAKVVLVILLIASVFSWAIIFSKWGRFRRARSKSAAFVRQFRRAASLGQFVAVAENFKPSPLVAVLEGAVEELKRQNPGLRSIASVQRAMQIASSEELTRLERRIPWLATIGAVTPFIGLFGTVWGIIDAFQGLGNAGAATLRAVAPGISEALITTAAGLFAAIPAVIAYNHFVNEVKQFGARMDDFSLEILNTVERGAAAGKREAVPVSDVEYKV